MGTADAPVAASERYDSLDVLRGIAVLAIFAVNIRNMLGPMNTMFDPGYFTGPHDLAIDRVLQFAVDGKWVATFSVLFGAGVMLLGEKAQAAGIRPRDRIAPRQLWLLAFGLVHMILIWPGDILTSYALVGLLAMLFVTRRSGTLILWAALGIGATTALMGLLSLMFTVMPA